MNAHCHDAARHAELHTALDELLACWLLYREPGQAMSTFTVAEFLEWSSKQLGE